MTRAAAGAVVLGLVGCAGGAATGPAPLSNAVPGTAVEQSPPPSGTILPRTGTPRRARYWGKMGESTWEAIYEVSPTDAGVRHVIANARRMALRFDAGDAGLALYREQLGAAGVSLDDAEATRLSYRIQSGARVVTAFSDDEHTSHDPNLFVLIVDTPGG